MTGFNKLFLRCQPLQVVQWRVNQLFENHLCLRHRGIGHSWWPENILLDHGSLFFLLATKEVPKLLSAFCVTPDMSSRNPRVPRNSVWKTPPWSIIRLTSTFYRITAGRVPSVRLLYSVLCWSTVTGLLLRMLGPRLDLDLSFGLGSKYTSSSSARRYSPGWALASLTISLHWSLFLAFSVQPLIPIFLRSSSSIHLNLGLPILLFAYSFPFSTLQKILIHVILNIRVFSSTISLHSDNWSEFFNFLRYYTA